MISGPNRVRIRSRRRGSDWFGARRVGPAGGVPVALGKSLKYIVEHFAMVGSKKKNRRQTHINKPFAGLSRIFFLGILFMRVSPP